ncbi:MAG: ANTAR domain-containing protein [Clostridiales bacterium]|jgi:response regulator NasT|nr:ANTAR domain-containing protein [Eubacteriales bacterium]MDH7567560.1 ANTAR domain-containing protein [Clostridiales bacterium]
MESARIIVAMNNDTSINKMRAILTENGYIVVDLAKDGHECLRKIRLFRPDIVIVDFNLPLTNGYEIAKVAIEDNICDVILITANSQYDFADEIKSDSGFVCMEKPLSKVSLINTIELMVKSKRKIRQLEKEIEELKANLDTRKDVEKAKGLLMKHLNLTEEEAFKRIQKQSMDRGIPMREIARAIILAYAI